MGSPWVPSHGEPIGLRQGAGHSFESPLAPATSLNKGQPGCARYSFHLSLLAAPKPIPPKCRAFSRLCILETSLQSTASGMLRGSGPVPRLTLHTLRNPSFNSHYSSQDQVRSLWYGSRPAQRSTRAEPASGWPGRYVAISSPMCCLPANCPGNNFKKIISWGMGRKERRRMRTGKG